MNIILSVERLKALKRKGETKMKIIKGYKFITLENKSSGSAAQSAAQSAGSVEIKW